MGQTVLTLLGIAQAAVGLTMLVVMLGRWTKRVERRSAPRGTDHDHHGQTNGIPTNGELARRLAELREEIEGHVTQRQYEDMWRAIRDAHRRIDSMKLN